MHFVKKIDFFSSNGVYAMKLKKSPKCSPLLATLNMVAKLDMYITVRPFFGRNYVLAEIPWRVWLIIYANVDLYTTVI